MISINRYKLAIYCFHPFHFSHDVEDAGKSLPIRAGETAQLAKDLLSKHENLSWVPGTYIKPRSNGEPSSMSLEDRQKDPWSALASQPSQSVSSGFRERLSLKMSKVEKQLRKTVLISVVTRTQGEGKEGAVPTPSISLTRTLTGILAVKMEVKGRWKFP